MSKNRNSGAEKIPFLREISISRQTWFGLTVFDSTVITEQLCEVVVFHERGASGTLGSPKVLIQSAMVRSC